VLIDQQQQLLRRERDRCRRRDGGALNLEQCGCGGVRSRSGDAVGADRAASCSGERNKLKSVPVEALMPGGRAWAGMARGAEGGGLGRGGRPAACWGAALWWAAPLCKQTSKHGAAGRTCASMRRGSSHARCDAPIDEAVGPAVRPHLIRPGRRPGRRRPPACRALGASLRRVLPLPAPAPARQAASRPGDIRGGEGKARAWGRPGVDVHAWGSAAAGGAWCWGALRLSLHLVPGVATVSSPG
jgi:hypothetical protein